MRATIKGSVPELRESLEGQNVVYHLLFLGNPYQVVAFGTWTKWWSVYLAPELLAGQKKALRGRYVKNGTVRFAYDEEPPLALISFLTQVGYADAVRRVQRDWYSD